MAQRQRFDSYLDKAAAKEDFQWLEKLEREKKRPRFEETVPDVPNDAGASSCSGSKSSGSKRGSSEDVDDKEREIRAKVQEKRGEKREDNEETDREVRTKFHEQRGEKRPEDGDPEREARAKVREKRGEKRVSEDDGRADLDEAAAAAAAKTTKIFQIHTPAIATHVGRKWIDEVDED